MEAPRGPGAHRPLQQDEPELLARCRAGESAAFATLVDRYRDRAYGLALRLTRSAPDAEEVAQDAFVSAWRSLPAFRGDAAFSTWLYRIVWRKALDRVETLRNRSRREVAVDDPARVEAEFATATATTATTAAAGGSGVGAADSARLDRLLDTLSELSRAVVTLYGFLADLIDQLVQALSMATGLDSDADDDGHDGHDR